MRRPPRPQDDDRDGVGEHRDDDDGHDDDDHSRAVETNAGESDGDDANQDPPNFAVEAINQFNANFIG